MGLVRCIFVVIAVMVPFQLPSEDPNYWVPNPWVPLVDQLIAREGPKLASKYDLTLFGDGGAMYDCIHYIVLAFSAYRPMSQDEGRALIVDLMDDFLSAINADTSIRPYLDRYPATAENITVKIFLWTKEGALFAHPHIGTISNIRDKIYYDYPDPDKPFGDREVKIETYEEAKEIVERQRRTEEAD